MKKSLLALICSVFFFNHIFLSAQDEVAGGYTVGLNVGIPVVQGVYLEGESGTNLGLIVGTPYGLPLGPLNIGVGIEALTYNFPDAANGDGFKGYAFLGTLNFNLNDLLVYPATLPVGLSLQLGGGLYGGGVGTTIGGSIELPLEKLNLNIPLTVKVYGRGNAMTDAGSDSNIEGKPTGWVNAGMMVSYDITSLLTR